MRKCFWVLASLTALASAPPLLAQAPPAVVPTAAPAAAPATAAANPTTVCGSSIPAPASVPPAGSGPVVFLIFPCWEAQGNQTVIEPQTYLYYIQLKSSAPSQ